MLFRVSAELEYVAKFPSTLILNIQAQRNASQVILDEQLTVEPRIKVAEFTDATDNRFLRLETGEHKTFALHYTASVDCDVQTYRAGAVEPTPVAELSASTIPYLFPSRYCQSDRLSRLAWDLFGAIDNPHEKVVAICDWIHANVEYLRGSTDSMTSAFDTVTQRTGVCRDFSHLGIALCRALNIPARYFAGYAYELEPPDFHACFECFIGGSWTVFDATQLAHLNGLVRIGTGRDAADAAVASIFGSAACQKMVVACRLGEGQAFRPIDRQHLARGGVALGAGLIARCASTSSTRRRTATLDRSPCTVIGWCCVRARATICGSSGCVSTWRRRAASTGSATCSATRSGWSTSSSPPTR